MMPHLSTGWRPSATPLAHGGAPGGHDRAVTSSRIVRACASLAVLAALAAGSAASASAKTMPQQQPLRILIVPEPLAARARAAGEARRGRDARARRRADDEPPAGARGSRARRGRERAPRRRRDGCGPRRRLQRHRLPDRPPRDHPHAAAEAAARSSTTAATRSRSWGAATTEILISRTTRIPGLVSILDVAPTALQRPGSELLSAAQPDAARTVENLDAADRREQPAEAPLARSRSSCSSASSRSSCPPAAFPAISAALLGSLGLGFVGPTNVAVLVAAFVALTLLGGIALAQDLLDGVATPDAPARGARGVRGRARPRPDRRRRQSARADAELAFLRGRQPGRDAAARPCARSRRSRGSPVRTARLPRRRRVRVRRRRREQPRSGRRRRGRLRSSPSPCSRRACAA